MKRYHYVLVFPFTLDLRSIWLIEKQKPNWQKGLLNGIGGKVETGESAIIAAQRELEEETGLSVQLSYLSYVGYMHGVNNDDSKFRVDVYTLKTDKQLESREQEKVALYELYNFKDKMIENLPLWIEASKYKLGGGSNFSEMELKY